MSQAEYKQVSYALRLAFLHYLALQLDVVYDLYNVPTFSLSILFCYYPLLMLLFFFPFLSLLNEIGKRKRIRGREVGGRKDRQRSRREEVLAPGSKPGRGGFFFLFRG
jgi:hypothetical protein